MKIEKVNDHQIRCTLTREDLASRELKISELAYGTTKAKNLFKDMMEMADCEYGFKADNIPLMIEAIPVNSECIVLIITKVEDPEELDTRFSKFAPGIHDEADDDDDVYEEIDSNDSVPESNDTSSVLDLFKRFSKEAENAEEIVKKTTVDGMVFVFDTMANLYSISARAMSIFSGTSSLFFDEKENRYLMVIKRGKMDFAPFVQVCNLFAEYGQPAKGRTVSEAYLTEHYETICKDEAIKVLAELN